MLSSTLDATVEATVLAEQQLDAGFVAVNGGAIVFFAQQDLATDWRVSRPQQHVPDIRFMTEQRH